MRPAVCVATTKKRKQPEKEKREKNMPFDAPTELVTQVATELEKPPTKGRRTKKEKSLLVCPPVRQRKKEVLEESFLDPKTYLFSRNTDFGEVHEYLMTVFLEEGDRPADILEMGYRISHREDCKHGMLLLCNALSDLAQAGKIRVKAVTTTNDRFHLYGNWAEA
jgi:hypothetical protein